MMALADLALVTDAPGLVGVLARRLGLGQAAGDGAAGGADRRGRRRRSGRRWLSSSTWWWWGRDPAGSAAALVAAQAGRSVCLLERGPFPGAKNMYGGVTYGRVLDDLVPRWWEEMPVQRWVTRRSTMVATGDQSVTVDVRGAGWGGPPYNGATTFRSEFDAWLAAKAVAAGALLVTATTATGLLRDPGRFGDRGAHRPARRRPRGQGGDRL